MAEGVSHHSDDLADTFRLECPDGHIRFAILGGRDRRLAEERGEVRRRCWGCNTDRIHEVVAP